MTNITSNYFVENFRYKFVFEADYGNNMYLGDINLYAGAPSDSLMTNGISELDPTDTCRGFPNPVEDELTVEFTARLPQIAEIVITDLSGAAFKRTK